jgi:endonuclease III
MEPHKNIPNKVAYIPATDDVYEYFQCGRRLVKDYYSQVEEDITNKNFTSLTHEAFFTEYVWVVHATGFSAKAVGKFMPNLLKAYGSIEECSRLSFDEVFDRVRKVCNNNQKAKAVKKMAESLDKAVKSDWNKYKNDELSNVEKLADLPYIGKVTCFHLGRNIGHTECVKPDLHLIRMAEHWGYESPLEMCKDIQIRHEKETGETVSLGIVDLTFWYMASTLGTLDIRKEGQR